ncbi:DUF5908 family protein [Vibrio sp. MEBiC08052]|uniref:DUF5908 family protein n=1 Tax=Vibrio sp. MEBiC08052 TaxID=1761910 RepID=UPI0007405DE9|nr:DUF5908 family protein [Vibrio sp. MEBiC08052]KUI96891.1 hypothetical protein VRK_40720 [Vibrio sp. MEBiC08052]
MPVEIRELVIKTEIRSQPEELVQDTMSEQQLHALKQHIIQECLKQLRHYTRNSPLER